MSDETDWHRSIECSEIDPTVLPRERIERLRAAGMRRLIVYKLLRHPLQVLRLLRRLARNMPLGQVAHLLAKPFLRRKPAATRSAVLARAVEDEEMMRAVADLEPLSDAALEEAVLDRRAEAVGGAAGRSAAD